MKKLPKLAKKLKGITKIGDNFVENQCGLLYAIPTQNG